MTIQQLKTNNRYNIFNRGSQILVTNKDSTVFITQTKREPGENAIALHFGSEKFVI